MATRTDGIDVSRWQGHVDWSAVRYACANPDAALASWKVTQGTHTVDPMGAENRTNSAAAGFRYRFGYHWLSAGVDPIVQADWFLYHFAPLNEGEGVILDCEETGITASQVVAWCERVESVTKRPVAIYTGVYVAGGSIWKSDAIFGSGKRMRWVAAYVSEARVRTACKPYGFDVWQWSSSGTVPGVLGRCDVNMIEHIDQCNLATTKEIPVPVPPPIPPIPPSEMEDPDMANICTNSEPYKGYAPNVVKWVVMANGSLRHIGEAEWHARGTEVGSRITNAEITALGGTL
ncbi:Acm Lyzozyme M1 (1,4-beta-N-acetylmuramidase) [uncultured Caudovirales phage]|uniref:lysozyme n=1 Tax=uncultured Caudovirales phage TaxID=2100421 RepID=A0A6J5RFC4_9CAUD|nr:Acm Lyzozyme M1 (1,4-beta-N-acetylmuramidase) [uncultured Caudovirales phage]